MAKQGGSMNIDTPILTCLLLMAVVHCRYEVYKECRDGVILVTCCLPYLNTAITPSCSITFATGIPVSLHNGCYTSFIGFVEYCKEQKSLEVSGINTCTWIHHN